MSIESPAKKDAATVSENSGGLGTDKKVTSLPLRMRARVLSFYRQSPGIVIASSIAVLVAAAYLLAAPMGRDLTAQMAHAELAQQHWPVVLDLRWYGGFDPLGYSVLSPLVMALLGVRVTTALAYVACVMLFAALLKRTAVARPLAGAITGAVCLTGNLVVTRTTFELGLSSSARRTVGSGLRTPAHHGRAGRLSNALQPSSRLVPGSRRRRAFPDPSTTGGHNASCQCSDSDRRGRRSVW